MDKQTIIQVCKDKRQASGEKQVDIANKLGWPKGRISEFESGKVNYTTDKLLTILDAYGVTISIA